MADRKPNRSSYGKLRLRHVAGSKRRDTVGSGKQQPHWARRLRTWVIGVVVAGLGLGVTDLVSRTVDKGASQVEYLILNPPPGSRSGLTVQDQTVTSDGLTIYTTVLQGLGCEGSGDVYPTGITPGISPTVVPGTGPTHGGKTWDQSPGEFGAVPASPTEIKIYLTGPTNHAVIITDLKFHVISHKPQVKGALLNVASGCGGAGSYQYGVVDLDS